MSYPCNIIQDLLPSYVDGLCSAESQRAVEEHVRGCEPCRQILDAMQAKEYELPDPAQNIKKKRPFQKLRNRVLSLIMAVVLVCGSVSVFFHYNQNFYYQYLHWGNRIHINLTVVNDLPKSIPINEYIQVRYLYIGDDTAAYSKTKNALTYYSIYNPGIPEQDVDALNWVPASLTRISNDDMFTASFAGGKKGYYIIRIDIKPSLFQDLYPEVTELGANWPGAIYSYDVINPEGWELWDFHLELELKQTQTNVSIRISDQFTSHTRNGSYTSNWFHHYK